MHDRRMRVGDRARAVLASPERCALFIDIDGTLLGVAPTPDAVSVPAGLVRLLEDVVRGLGGAARESPHLGCDDREAVTVLTSSRGFERGIQREQL